MQADAAAVAMQSNNMTLNEVKDDSGPLGHLTEKHRTNLLADPYITFLTPFRRLHALPSLLKAILSRAGRADAGGPGADAGTGVGHLCQPLCQQLTPVSPLPPLQEFVQLAKRLVSDPALGRDLGASGRAYVTTHHAWRAERDTYQHLIQMLEGGAGHRAC